MEIVGEVQSPNILNWYPFKENQKIKEIKNIEEIDLCNEKFDVIILVGIFENQNIKLKELIKKVEKILEEKGKILITIDNKFGLEAFNGTPDKIYKKKFASLTGYNNEQNKRETYTKSSIENEIRKLGYNMRFYYPLPDYKKPNVIFTDEQLPEYNSIDKYHPYYIENNDITFNEIDVFREILKTDKNMFTFFANSFLIEITKGECVCVIGPSGSGKTTLLSILGTILRPDSGIYLLDGMEMTTDGIDLATIRNSRIGFVFQDHRLMPQYTVLENILLPALATASRCTREEIEYAHQLMELTHISKLAGQYPHTLSGGEASRVAVCRALIRKPLLVLADEPTGQLDKENARNIASLFSEINLRMRTTIVMVTHSDETSSFAHRILKLNGGILE